MSADIVFTKENPDTCLSRLAKEFRKLNGTKVHAEIVLIEGAAVLVNYGFRDMTQVLPAHFKSVTALVFFQFKIRSYLPLISG